MSDNIAATHELAGGRIGTGRRNRRAVASVSLKRQAARVRTGCGKGQAL